MKYDRILGEKILNKYLSLPRYKPKFDHSQFVGEFAYKVAHKIKLENPELKQFDPELVGFLGYVHDIGVYIHPIGHERHTIGMLINNENIPPNIAQMTIHGQLIEQHGKKDNKIEEYTPIGLEGMILTYADMSIKTKDPMSIEKRRDEIVQRVQGIKRLSDEIKKDIIDNLHIAMPRFKRYEKIILTLANVNSYKDF